MFSIGGDGVKYCYYFMSFWSLLAILSVWVMESIFILVLYVVSVLALLFASLVSFPDSLVIFLFRLVAIILSFC
jgi:hypothetical protein